MYSIALRDGVACSSVETSPATLYRFWVYGPRPVDIPTFDKAGPVKTGPCKLYGLPAIVYRATVCYPYSRQTFRHPLTSRDEPPRRWIPPGVTRGTEDKVLTI